jgi:hypothetical protein
MYNNKLFDKIIRESKVDNDFIWNRLFEGILDSANEDSNDSKLTIAMNVLNDPVSLVLDDELNSGLAPENIFS